MMKHNSNQKRGRSRNNGKRNNSLRGQKFEGGFDNKMRGSAKQLLDKYTSMAHDASLSGDRIASENYFQHAEHYHRIVNANNDSGGQVNHGRNDGHKKNGENKSIAVDMKATSETKASEKIQSTEKQDKLSDATPNVPVSEPEPSAA